MPWERESAPPRLKAVFARRSSRPAVQRRSSRDCGARVARHVLRDSSTTLPRRPLCLFPNSSDRIHRAATTRASEELKATGGENVSADGDWNLADPLLPLTRTRFVHRFATRIDGDGDRHVLDVEFVDRFHAEIGKADDFRSANGFRYQIGGAAHCDQ